MAREDLAKAASLTYLQPGSPEAVLVPYEVNRLAIRLAFEEAQALLKEPEP